MNEIGAYMEKDELLKAIFERVSTIDYIKPGTIPNIDLYMDQVTTFMDTHLENSKRKDEDKILTKTMINNYAKNNLLPPPERKKYSRDHLILLVFIYYYKGQMSISDIQILLDHLKEKHFQKDEAPDLEEIYSIVYDLCKAQSKRTLSDIMQKYKASADIFHTGDEKEDYYLQLFTMVCSMSFDLCLKKVAMETIIDYLGQEQTKNEAYSSKADKTEKQSE